MNSDLTSNGVSGPSSAVATFQGLSPPVLSVEEDAQGSVTCTREQWRVWKKRWEAYRKLAKLASEPTEQQMAVLILCLSEKTLMVVDSDLPYECEEDREDPGKTIQLLERPFLAVNET